MNSMDVAELAKKMIAEAIRERGHVNILVAGRTGVGKSTLINSVFQGNLASTGQGRPVTRETREITKEDIPLSILDTRGLEMADFRACLAALQQLVRERCNDRDPNRHIHVAWVCISEDLRRVEDAEIALCDQLSMLVPVLGVVTKARADQGFRAEVQRLLPQAKNVVRVRAIPDLLDDGHILPPMGLKELVELTVDLVPLAHKRAFAAAQKANLALKKKQAQMIVGTAATAAAGIALSPIPFSDAALILPTQVSMLAGISATYGLALGEGLLVTLLTSIAGGTLATVGGRMLAANLLKLFPGAGSIAGGAISAATAAAVTTALGTIYIATLEALFTKKMGESPTAEEVVSEFNERWTS